MKMITGGWRYRGNIPLFMAGLTRNAQVIANDLANEAIRNAPKASYELAKSISGVVVPQEDPSIVRVEVRATAPHAATQELGSGLYATRSGTYAGSGKEYMIKPRGLRGKYRKPRGLARMLPGPKAALSFIWAGHGRAALAFVMHPGVHGTHYMQTAFEEYSASQKWSSVIRPTFNALLYGDWIQVR